MLPMCRKMLNIIQRLLVLTIVFQYARSTTNEKLKQQIDDAYELSKIYLKAEANISDILINLYTRNNVNVPIIFAVGDMESMQNTSFNPTKLTVIAFHGWNTAPNDPSNIRPKNALLRKIECNFIVVDWSVYANLDYLESVDSLASVAQIVADFINLVIKTFQLSIENIRIYGHSLGGQLVGFIGERMEGKIPVIISLDPAYPLFNCSDPGNCIDPTDAQFVQIIHTSTKFPGHPDPLGNADFYPNGGESQPNCGDDVFGDCSHARAWIYLEESILTGGFTGSECDNWDNFTNGICIDNPTASMGGIDFQIDVGARGVFYLMTNLEPPFSMG